MPPPVQKKSYGSVTVFWLDREAAVEELTRAARALVEDDPNVRSVRLFGSLMTGKATAASDADLLLVLEESDLPLLDRPARYSRFFADVGMPVDLFVYTRREIERAPTPIAECALAASVRLAGR